MNTGYALFKTPIGPCGLAWGDRGLVGVQLPEGTVERTRLRMARRFPSGVLGTPPAAVAAAQQEIVALLERRPSDLASIALDMDGLPDFHRRVYELSRRIPLGTTMTYGQMAAHLGVRDAARAVGQALGRNPFPIVVPCHRIVAAGGKLGGFTAPGGRDTKVALLTLEGALLV